MTQTPLEKLKAIRSKTKHAPQASLSDSLIEQFAQQDSDLSRAIDRAAQRFEQHADFYADYLDNTEAELIEHLRENILNFYPPESASPYVPVAAKGPWIVTFHGGVIYDVGGYGMLGFGHNPDFLKAPLSSNQVMANVMTPCFSHQRISKLLKEKIGFTRKACPYAKFSFLNSGSEGIAFGIRLSDARAKVVNSEQRKTKYLALKGGFHGRTYRGAQVSASTQKAYQNLASFKQNDVLDVVDPNDCAGLQKLFDQARKDGVWYEMFLLEPVMGEGRAGYAITPEFYSLARKLTKESRSLLLVDSVQAGLRCNGVLSLCDYPGFSDLEAPDIEVFSKAINAGQYPLSIISVNEKTAEYYKYGIYGNTMTGNPRALDVAEHVLQQLSDDLTSKIQDHGLYFKKSLSKLTEAYPEICGEVLGQGLLVSLQLNEQYAVEGAGAIEEQIRRLGINVIHGSGNRLRFTPWFLISEVEIDLIISVMEQVFKKLK